MPFLVCPRVNMQDYHGDGLPRGQRLGAYRFDRELGRGGFGITYLATDLNLDRQVAVKEYFPRDWAAREARWNVVARRGHERDFAWGLDRFKVEAQTLASLRHRNVVEVFTYFEEFSTGYIVMEFVDGEPLSVRLKRDGTLDEVEIRKWVLPALDGLEAVHRQGLLHRDIKPANILLVDEGCVLIDFGSARPTTRAAAGEATTVLTPSYAALEQLTGAPQREATDIYSLGAVLYHCVTGEAPQDPRNNAGMGALARQQEYSSALICMISAALAVQMEDRPQTVADWRALMGVAQAIQPDTVSAGLDPDVLVAGAKYAFAEMRLGARKFADYANAALDAIGPRVVPYLRDSYEAARDVAPWSDQMSTSEEIDAWHKAYAEEEARSNANAQYTHGKLAYEKGDADEAESRYASAAEQGHGMAQYALAMMFWNDEIGFDTEERVSQAVFHCEEAVRRGVEEARAFLDRDIQRGVQAHREGGNKEAEREYRRLAERDDEHERPGDCIEAEFRLARMYAAGETGCDPATAYDGALMWFRRSAGHGYQRAIYGAYATLSGKYDILTFYDETGDGALEAQQWYWKAAELDAVDQYRLGLFGEADEDHADDKEAEFWHRLAANRGHTDAQFRLGMILDGRRNCDEEGVEWLNGAATKGHLAAASLLTPSRLLGLEAVIEPKLSDDGKPYDAMPFADFVEGMLPALGDSTEEIRPLLRRLYAAYRAAAQISGAGKVENLSSETEIDDWYARHQLTDQYR